MIGELAALSAALLWAVASILFAQISTHVRAINLNLIKGLLGCSMIVVLLSIGSLMGGDRLSLAALSTISTDKFVLLFISGAVGIGFGDTAYFACLRRIGPQKGLMLESFAPIIAALLVATGSPNR